MANYFVNLPAAKMPGNAMMDLSGINNAFDGIRQQRNVDTQRADMLDQRDYARGRDAKQDKQQDFQRQGMEAAAIAKMQGPMRDAAWQRFVAKHPNPSSLGPEYMDPTRGPAMVAAEIGQYYDPRESKLKDLQIQGAGTSNALHAQQLAHSQAMNPLQVEQQRIAVDTARRNFNEPKPTTFDLGEGHVRYETIRNPDGTTGYRKVAEGGAKLNATTQKAIDEADDFVKQSGNAIGSIREAIRLNDTAYSGVTAGARAAVMNNIPLLGGTKESFATTDLDNLITNQALSALRTTFGGNPTEGERRILLEVQGSVNLPAPARKTILERALRAAEQSQQFNLQKGDALRGGTYYQPGGVPRAATAPAAPAGRYTATNPQTGQKIVSDDGVSWRPADGR